MNRRAKHRFIGALVTLVGLGVLGSAFLYSGTYDTSAFNQHTAPVFWLLDVGMKQSVKRHSADIEVPPLDDERQIARGLALYRQSCVICHGAPGVAPAPFALGLTPAPGNLAFTAREWTPAMMYWVIKSGIKMAGMPAWQYRMTDADLWALVAFMQRLPLLSPAQYHAWQAPEATPAPRLPEGPPDAERGAVAIQQYACVTCHAIPGIVGAGAPVGPPLAGIASRGTIAGLLPNNFDNMVRWLREPRRINPDGAMPDLYVSERDARDMAAYLATLQ